MSENISVAGLGDGKKQKDEKQQQKNLFSLVIFLYSKPSQTEKPAPALSPSVYNAGTPLLTKSGKFREESLFRLRLMLCGSQALDFAGFKAVLFHPALSRCEGTQTPPPTARKFIAVFIV